MISENDLSDNQYSNRIFSNNQFSNRIFPSTRSLKKNQNAPRPSEHPPVKGEKCQNVILSKKIKNSFHQLRGGVCTLNSIGESVQCVHSLLYVLDNVVTNKGRTLPTIR